MAGLRWALLAVVCALATAASPPALAQGAEHAAGDAAFGKMLVASPLLLIPSALGPEVAMEGQGNRDGRFVLAWPFQVPLPLDLRGMAPHRLAAAVEVAFGAANGSHWRARAGYRYGGARLIAGAGAGVESSGTFFSPELGVRMPARRPDDEIFPYGTLIARADLPFSAPERPRISLMIGWIIF